MKKFIIVLLALILVPFPSAAPHRVQPSVTTTAQKPFDRIFEREITCLAKNIYYEAPAESYEGKLAVATVTMNRVEQKGFPKTICGVVYQKNSRGCQFSWTCGSRARMNVALYNEAKKIAHDVLTNNLRLTSIKNALYFHNTSVRPRWSFARPIKKIDNHIFYVVKSDENKTRNDNPGT